jgi:hypothetical protein
MWRTFILSNKKNYSILIILKSIIKQYGLIYNFSLDGSKTVS